MIYIEGNTQVGRAGSGWIEAIGRAVKYSATIRPSPVFEKRGLSAYSHYIDDFRRRDAPAKPINPEPNSQAAAGTGTAATEISPV